MKNARGVIDLVPTPSMVGSEIAAFDADDERFIEDLPIEGDVPAPKALPVEGGTHAMFVQGSAIPVLGRG